MLNNFLERFEKVKATYHQRKGAKEQLDKEIEIMQTKAKLFNHKREIFEKATILLQKASETAREYIKNHFENLVSYALQAIYDEDYQFKIKFTTLRNAVNVQFFVITPKNSALLPPQDSRGGGVVDVVSLALRIAMMEFYSPRIEGPILLDESLKHLSAKHVPAAANFFKAIKERIHRQIIFVTHQRNFGDYADKIFKVEQSKGESKITLE